METNGHPADRAVTATLDYEMQLVREAIAMVAKGAAPRMVVASIHFGEALLDPAQQIARASGVRIVPLWSADEGAVDLAIEPLRA